ncbi:hypothetical protein ZWY2020_022861 [Hordeum vulgare]|nr:hypothetical protein ZWY2020_022861 [Hordeum vulgare]
MASGGGSGGSGFLNLERHFTFYGAYHSNPVNVFIHTLFIWPIFLTALLLLHLTAHSKAVMVFTAYGAFTPPSTASGLCHRPCLLFGRPPRLLPWMATLGFFL